MSEPREEIKRGALQKSPSLSRVQSSRHSSPSKCHGGARSPPVQKKVSSGSQSSVFRTPASSPPMGRGQRSASCKENFDYEESMALAMALSKSIYLETPLPVIPGLSSHKPQAQEVLAHPHRDVSVCRVFINYYG